MEKKAQHTPEPWETNQNPVSISLYDGDRFEVFTVERNKDRKYGEVLGLFYCAANAERIVACVNACAGIEDPEKTIPEAMEALRFKRQWQGKQ